MNKFKVNDRVVAYSTDEVYFGTVVKLTSGDEIVHLLDESSNLAFCFHYKQCRRLVKKKKADFILYKFYDSTRHQFFWRTFETDSAVPLTALKKIKVREVKE